jgi:beta-fructofuranosidase
VTLKNIEIREVSRELLASGGPPGKKVVALSGDAVELRIAMARHQAERKLFGVTLFADGRGGGLPIVFRPETGALRVGTAEAPFSVADLPPDEDLQLRVFVDKYLVEVFVNDRQAMVASYKDFRGQPDIAVFTVGAPTTIKSLEMWRLKPTNQGFLDARNSRVWQPKER